MKRKFLIFLFGVLSLVCLCVGLIACGNEGGSSSNNMSEGVAQTSGQDADDNVNSKESDENGWNYLLSNDGTYYTIISYNGEDTELVIPSTFNGIPVTKIGNGAFFSGLYTSITISNSITSIGENAFYECTAEIIWGDNPAITEIGNYAFENYLGKSITIPDSVTSIGDRAFYNCTVLTEINFNAVAMNDLSSSNNYVFYNAGQSGNGITVTIGANVTKIPAYLFYPYYSSSFLPYITSVVFEDGSACESIGSYAFAYCNSVTSVIV